DADRAAHAIGDHRRLAFAQRADGHLGRRVDLLRGEAGQVEAVRADVAVELAIERAEVAEHLAPAGDRINRAVELGDEIDVLPRALAADPQVVRQSPAARVFL